MILNHKALNATIALRLFKNFICKYYIQINANKINKTKYIRINQFQQMIKKERKLF